MKPIVAAIAVLVFSSLAQAQDKKGDFAGWYAGASGGTTLGGYRVGGYTVQISQTSGINVPTRGIIIVPGTTRDIPATSTGGSVDFTVPTCTSSVNPNTYVCTGNRTLGTFGNGVTNPTTAPGSRSKAFLGGGQIGYNKQFTRFVLGGEAEFSGSTLNGRSQVIQILPSTALTNCVFGSQTVPAPQPCTPTVTTYTREANSHWTSSLRARAGWIWHGALLYGTAGPVVTTVAVKATDTLFITLSNGADCPCGANSGSAQRGTGLVSLGPIVGASNNTHLEFGWTAGGGVERPLWHHLRFGLEYRHSQLSGRSYAGTNSALNNPPNPAGQLFQGGGLAVPATKVDLVEDRIFAKFNVHF